MWETIQRTGSARFTETSLERMWLVYYDQMRLVHDLEDSRRMFWASRRQPFTLGLFQGCHSGTIAKV
jgi:hypothetical protein